MTTNAQSHVESGDPTIRDAACLILVDRTQAEPRVLMGRRLPSQVFLPNKWVFPGGRVDDDDRALAAIMTKVPGPRCSTEAAQFAFALAAVRETFEETGQFLGRSASHGQSGLPPVWQAIADQGLSPSFDQFRPLARAITPPGLPRRFDTWFFIAEHDCDAPALGQPDGELLDLGWFTLYEARALDLAIITRLIVDDVASALVPGEATDPALVAFYYQDVDAYRRVLIDAPGPLLAP